MTAVSKDGGIGPMVSFTFKAATTAAPKGATLANKL